MSTSTGYGPRTHQIQRPIVFCGDERRYELWETKFLGYMRIRGLKDVFKNLHDQIDVDADQNEEAFAELVQVLDDRSLSLIIRDAKDDGRQALKILRSHYMPKGKSRIISLYNELTSLVYNSGESMTDYIIRAETASNSLKQAGETVSDSLLIAMVLKGLPARYQPFITVTTQREKSQSFSEFKESLRNQEDAVPNSSEYSVMNFHSKTDASRRHQQSPMVATRDDAKAAQPTRWCNECKSKTHDTQFCRNRKRWCEHCKTKSHDTKFCRKLRKSSSAKYINSTTRTNESNDFTFFVGNSINKNEIHFADTLLVDSGASSHIVNDKNKFVTFNSSFSSANHIIELADGRRLANLAQGQGDAIISLRDTQGIDHKVTLKNALFVPDFSQDIFSVPSAVQHNSKTKVEFTKDSGILSNGDSNFEIKRKGNLYFLNSLHHQLSARSLDEWHNVLGHCNKQDILLLERCVNGMKIKDPVITDDDKTCDVCLLGKMTQSRNRQPNTRANGILDRIHVDLAGPIEPTAKDNYKYALCCIDDFSGLTNVYFLKKKSDTCVAFQKFLAEMSLYGNVKCVRSDGGGEFTSNQFETLLIQNKIKHECSSPYSPHQNGIAERSWRTLFEMARCLLISSKLSKALWAYAVMYASYIRNRCFNHRIKCTPFEIFTGKKPDLSKLQEFGRECFAFIQNPKKLDDRSEKGVFIGFDKGSPAYLVYFPDREIIKKIRVLKFSKHDFKPIQQSDKHEEIISDVLIDDDDFHQSQKQSKDSFPADANVAPVDHGFEQSFNKTIDPPTTSNRGDALNNDSNSNTNSQNGSNDITKRQRSRPKHLNDYYVDDEIDDYLNVTVHFCYNISNDVLPVNFKDAMKCIDKDKWKNAMDDEMSALRENETFEITSLPTNRSAIGSRWVFTMKNGPNGEIKHKARFVAKGYSQLPGIDYEETFSPTARITSVRTMIQYAIQNNLTIHQMDVKSAYLNAPIDCEIYIEQPEGYEIKNDSNEKQYFRLKKSLYGLKQSGRNWNSLLHAFLVDQGFSQSQVDPCVYTSHSDSNNNFTMILCYVDDILLMSNSNSLLASVRNKLNDRFRMKDLGKISSFLGIDFNHDNETITMSQSNYLNKLLHRFDMHNCKPKYTPCDMNISKFENELSNETDARLYREIVGGLIYAMTCTRPDLSFIVTKLSQHMSKPNVNHMIMAKHTLRYIKATIDKKLIFQRSENPLKLTGYCDSDWANSEDRKSVSGYGFKLSDKGPLISWKSKKQNTIALSTCEAEYISLASAAQEGIYLLTLLNDVYCLNLTNFEMNCDNQSAISLAKNPIQGRRTKHIDIKYHFVRDTVQNNKMQINYIPSELNIADSLTKPMTKVKNERFREMIMNY